MLRAVVEQHAENAAFLFTMRGALVEAPHARVEDLVRADERVAANLEGLKIARAGGWKLALEALPRGGAGEVFAAAVLALESPSKGLVARVIEASPPEALARGLAGALAWLPFARAKTALAELRTSPSALLRRVALGAHSVHRRDPGRALDAALLDDDDELRATALRAIGELGRKDRRAALAAGLLADERDSRFWAAWSAVLLGDASAVPVLSAMATRGGAYAEAAATIAAIALPHHEAFAWIADLALRPELRRTAARAAAALGDPGSIPMLLDWMIVPALARVAADAMTTITGIVVAGDLADEPPPGFTSGPTDDPDEEDVTPDPDQHLAWPSAARLRVAWDRARPTLSPDVRHLLGQPVDRGSLLRALREGRQPERARAAFELGRLGEPLFDVTAPAPRQLRVLAALEVSPPRTAALHSA
jgi:uncharacterized protein (TIGR02270 family)